MTTNTPVASRWMIYWPIAAALVGLIVAGARADTHVRDHEVRLKQVEAISSGNSERLARMEQSVADTQIVVHRIEDKFDNRRH